MIRINLLPPEIIEKRKAEKRWFYLIAAAVVVFTVIFLFYGMMVVRVGMTRNELASRQQEAQSLQQQAARFAVFEQKKEDLRGRIALVDRALGGRINFSQLLSEISLVLPDDVWLISLSANDASGLDLQGFALDPETDSPDSGHKSMAKMLVRLSDLEQLNNVWLTGSSKDVYEDSPALSFSATAKIARPETQTPAPSVPAPPPAAQ